MPGRALTELINDMNGHPSVVARAWWDDTDPTMWMTDDGSPGWVNLAVYGVAGWEDEGGERIPLFEVAGADSNMTTTRDVTLAAPEAVGTVKWDGCVNYDLGSGADGIMAHACDLRDMMATTRALVRAYELALTLAHPNADHSAQPPGAVVHIAGPVIQIGNQRRQRCSWCGTLLEDWDLTRVAVAIEYGPDGQPLPWDGPAGWPVGGLVNVSGGVSFTVEHDDGKPLPPEACGQLPYEITAGRSL